MVRIFLSGGMTGLTYEEMNSWRQFFKDEFKDEAYVISPTEYFKPCSHYKNKDEEAEVNNDAYHFDLYWLKKSDIVIVNLNKLDSVGTAQEVMLAHMMGKPIIMIIKKDLYDNLHSWYKQEATKFFCWENGNYKETLNDVANYIRRFYI